jgi:hypothetical protein
MTLVRRLISPLRRSIGLVECSLARCGAGKLYIGEEVGLRFVHEGGELWQLRPQLIGNAAPLLFRGLGIVLSEGGGDEGGDEASAIGVDADRDDHRDRNDAAVVAHFT